MGHPATGFETRRQWPLWGVGALALLWLAVALGAAAGLLPAGTGQSLLIAALPPLIVLLLLLAFLSIGRRPVDIDAMEERVTVATRAAGDLEEQLGRIHSALLDCSARVEELRTSTAAEGAGLAATAQALEVAAGNMALSSADMGKAASGLLEIVPGLAGQAREAEAAMRIAGSEARRQLETVEATLAQVAAHSRDAGREAETMVGSMQGLIGQIDQNSAETTKTIANRAYTLDAAITGVLDRSAEAFRSIGDALQDQAQRVEQMVANARHELDGFGADGTRVLGQRIDVLLGAASQLKQQFQEHQALSDTVHAHAGASIDAIEGRLAGLRSQQASVTETMLAEIGQNTAALESRLGDLAERQQQAEAVQTERLGAALAGLEARMHEIGARQNDEAEALHGRMSAMVDAVEQRLQALKQVQQQLGTDLEAGADALATGIEHKLDRLTDRQTDIRTRLEQDATEAVALVEARITELRQRQSEAAASMREESEQGIAAIGARLAGLGHEGAQQFQGIAAQVASALSVLDGLQASVADRQQAVEALHARIAGLDPEFAGFADGAAARLPALADGFDSLSERGNLVSDQLDTLGAQIGSQVELLRDSSAAFERDHAAVSDLARSLAGEFENARAMVQDIHASTEQTAIAAASRMVENVMQVRQAVNGTAGEIRTLLTSVVDEAEAALDELASTRAEAAFGAPIRLQIASLEDASVKAAEAAATASERLSGQLVDLLRVIAETEARVDEVDTRMDVRARDTLAARSLRLVDSLQEASVDIAKLLTIDVEDGAWARYLSGDRSLFARSVVRLADKETSRRIHRHYQHDDAFREEASRYLEQFGELIRRVLKDPDGEAFALVLLSSDIGKLYVLISQAVGRPIVQSDS